MATFKVIAGSFGEWKFAFAQIGPAYGDPQGLQLPLPGGEAKQELISKEQIAMLDIATEQSLAKMPAAIQTAVAGVESGTATEVLFVCLLVDGRSFLGRCEGSVFRELQEFTGTAPVPAPVAVGPETSATPELAQASGQVAPPPPPPPQPSKPVSSKPDSSTLPVANLEAERDLERTKSSGSDRKRATYVVVAALAIVALGFLFALPSIRKSRPSSAERKAMSNEPAESDPTTYELSVQGVNFATRKRLDEIRTAARGTGSPLTVEEMLSAMYVGAMVSAKQYDADYSADEVAADSKYAGKKLLVNGTVQRINNVSTGSAYLELRGANQSAVVNAWMSDYDSRWVETVKRGAEVLLVCDQSQRVLSVASFARCESLEGYLNRNEPRIQVDLRNALSGKVAVNRNFAQKIAWDYGIGSSITSDSPCLTAPNGTACIDYEADAAFKGKVQAKSNATLSSMQIQ